MSGMLLTLAHPALPLAWWAANSPQVVDLLSKGLGGSRDGPRRLLSCYYSYSDFYCERVEDRYLIFAVIGMCVGALVPAVLWAIAATQYKGKVTDQRGQFPQQVPEEFSLAKKDFRYGLCGICQDFQYCLHGWCCLPIRAADTYQAVSVSAFWCVVGAYFATWIVAQSIGLGISLGLRHFLLLDIDVEARYRLMQQSAHFGWFIADAVLALWLAGLRRQLRAKLGDETPGSKFWMDCVKYW